MTSDNRHDELEEQKYRAPALERGLDIIELLSKSSEPLSIKQICDEMGHTRQQLYRMIQVLETRGFIEKLRSSEAYIITPKLLSLGMERRAHTSLLEFCKPIMDEIAEKTSQSCHIAVISGEQIVVIARSESASSISYTLRLGYSRPIYLSASGKVIYAFSDKNTQTKLLQAISEKQPAEVTSNFVQRTEKIREQGYELADSQHVKVIVDISVPLMLKNNAIAALTISYLERVPEPISKEYCVELLREAGEKISTALNNQTIKPYY